MDTTENTLINKFSTNKIVRYCTTFSQVGTSTEVARLIKMYLNETYRN
jgi:hypothetical protein